VVPPLRERTDDLPELMSSLLARTFANGPNAALLAEYESAARIEGAGGVQLSIGRAASAPKSLTFGISSSSFRTLRAHSWPGNVREIDHLVTTAAVFALADALAAVEAGRADATAALILPISARLIRDLVHLPEGAVPSGPGRMAIDIEPAPTLHALSRRIESQVFRLAYLESGGDFRTLAARLLAGDAAANARRVRLRFNQLGLRVRRGAGREK
jgi:DNA-binding NtrC family response regulator